LTENEPAQAAVAPDDLLKETNGKLTYEGYPEHN